MYLTLIKKKPKRSQHVTPVGFGNARILTDCVQKLPQILMHKCPSVCLIPNLGKLIQTLVPCWMPKSLLPRNQYTGWFATTLIPYDPKLVVSSNIEVIY